MGETGEECSVVNIDTLKYTVRSEFEIRRAPRVTVILNTHESPRLQMTSSKKS